MIHKKKGTVPAHINISSFHSSDCVLKKKKEKEREG